MLNVIEVGAKIEIDDARLARHNCLSHSVYRLMRCPFRSVSIRPGLEVSFEDRLQDELECPLDHTIADRRNRQNADFRAPMGRYVLETSSSRICSRKLSTPLSSMASNVTPSIPGAPSFSCAIR